MMDRRGLQRKEKLVACATRKKKKANARDFFSTNLLKRLFTFSMLVAIVIGVFLVKRHHLLEQMTVSKVGQISVEGNKSIAKSELLGLLGVKNGDFLTSEKIDAAKKRILEHPRVAQVSISGNLRGQVKVFVRERTPVALLAINDQELVIDSEGKNMGAVAPAEKNINFFKVTGPWGLKEAGQLEPLFAEILAIRDQFLNYPQFGTFSQINYDSALGWSVFLSGLSFPIVVGQSISNEKMERLKKVLSQLGDQLSDVTKVDLDFSDRVVVKMKEAA